LAPILAMVARYAAYPLPFPILITGAPGSGKTVIARHLHDLTYQPRASEGHPFVVFNAAETPREHEMSYLFGHSRGAFTGAVETRKGALERANNGTLFIDEISGLSPLAQQLLLTSLPTGRFRRMGDDREIAVRFRFIGATNVDLEGMVTAGSFKRDLLDRLGPFGFRMPSLAERRDEILPLARGFLTWLAQQDRRGLRYRLSRDTERTLLRAPWPGNLRQLWFVCLHAAVLSDQEVLHVAALPEWLVDGDRGPQHGLIDDQRVQTMLVETGGNRSEAALRLGVTRRTVQRHANRALEGGG
jgi:DNA-binding NtrC family response regulator